MRRESSNFCLVTMLPSFPRVTRLPFFLLVTTLCVVTLRHVAVVHFR